MESGWLMPSRQSSRARRSYLIPIFSNFSQFLDIFAEF
jgi:hypothetical protein